MSQVRSLGLGVRLFFYSPAFRAAGGFARLSPFRETAVQAYADGAHYLHHMYENMAYARVGWVQDAMRRLHKSKPDGIGVFFPPVSAVADVASAAVRVGGRGGGGVVRGGAARPSFVARRHLEIFAEYAPYGLPDHAVGTWLAESYAAVASNHSSTRKRASRGPRARYEALIECGQSAVSRWLGGADPPPPIANCNRDPRGSNGTATAAALPPVKQ